MWFHCCAPFLLAWRQFKGGKFLLQTRRESSFDHLSRRSFFCRRKTTMRVTILPNEEGILRSGEGRLSLYDRFKVYEWREPTEIREWQLKSPNFAPFGWMNAD